MPEAKSKPYSISSTLNFINDNFALFMGSIAIFVIGFVIGSVWTENQQLKAGGLKQQPSAQELPAPEPARPLTDEDWNKLLDEPAFSIGDEDAKLTMVEFTDYQCPFCAQHYTQTHKALLDKYVKAGDLRIIYRDQALSFHQNANSAAQLVRCAAEQNKAEAMHDQLFSKQTEWSTLSGEGLTAKYREMAQAAGVNANLAITCLDSQKYKAAVDADAVLGNQVGAGGTPTFFINKIPLVGAQPLSEFERVIGEQLSDSGIELPGLPNAGRGN